MLPSHCSGTGIQSPSAIHCVMIVVDPLMLYPVMHSYCMIVLYVDAVEFLDAWFMYGTGGHDTPANTKYKLFYTNA